MLLAGAIVLVGMAMTSCSNLGENSKILMISNGTHNDYFDYWNKSELSTLTHWLDELGFMAE